MTQLEKAMTFCKASHSAIGQTRKYTGEPYWTHPFAVMRIVESVPHTETQLVAALLHDVVEDTQVTLDLVRDEFGNEVATIVDWLTDRSTLDMGNRQTRKAYDRERLATAPAEVQTVKLADLIHNSATITAHDPDFAKVYMKEKQLLLDVLTQGDAVLHARASAIVNRYFESQT
jgi:(p)ppGpp synthase/HD superfamily hydrolase